MKLLNIKKILAALVAMVMMLSVPAAVGAINDVDVSALAGAGGVAKSVFEKYKEQFGNEAVKTNVFEIIKQYQDRADSLILIFEDHERRLCAIENVNYVPKLDLSLFEKGKYDNVVNDSELIMKRCENHSVYDEYFERFTNDSDGLEMIKAYQDMFDMWVPMLIVHEQRLINNELALLGSSMGSNLFLKLLK